MNNKQLTKTEILSKMASYFFAYHDISISSAFVTKKEVVLVSKERIPVRLRERFFDKFELDKNNMDIMVTKTMDGKIEYKYTALKSPLERRIEVYLNSSISIIEPGPIMFNPKGDEK